MARAFWECDLEDARMAPSSLWVREMYTRPPLFFVTAHSKGVIESLFGSAHFKGFSARNCGTAQSKELSGGKRCSAKGGTHTPRHFVSLSKRGELLNLMDCKWLKTQGGNRAWQKPDGALK